MKRFSFVASFVMVFGLVSFFGAGCTIPSLPSSTASSLDAKEAAARLTFGPTDHFEIRQTFLGFGAFLPELKQSMDGVRLVQILRFAPEESADVHWTLSLKQETEASKKARTAYELDQQTHPKPIGESATLAPVPVMAEVTSSGMLTSIDLARSHTLFLPTYWSPNDLNLLREKSALWLADDVFFELIKTRRTTLNFGVFDEAAGKLLKNAQDLKAAVNRLRNAATEEEQAHDPNELKAEPDFIEWPLMVNGEKIQVSAIRASGWFGEIVVLNNRANPLVLKLTLNPIASGLADVKSGLGALQHVFGYEIANITAKEFTANP